MTDKPKKIKKELTVKSSTDNLSAIREFAKTTAADTGFSKEAVGQIVLAVDEACTNIIKHAYKYSPNGEIKIKIEFIDPKFSISITDEGTHFNPDLVPDPDLRIYHEEKRVGGLGMFLMKKLMDEVSYRNLSDDRNQVILVKYLT